MTALTDVLALVAATPPSDTPTYSYETGPDGTFARLINRLQVDHLNQQVAAGVMTQAAANTFYWNAIVQGQIDREARNAAADRQAAFESIAIVGAAVGGEMLLADTAPAAGVGAEAGAGTVSVDAGVSGADLAAGTADASPLTNVGVADMPIETTQPLELPGGSSNFVEGGGMPEQLAGPGTEPYSYKSPVELPQTVTPAARQSLIESIAAKTGSMPGAIATVNRLYSAVRGGSGKPGAGGAPVIYQRTGMPASGNAADTGGLGANVTPILKQLAIPALAVVASVLFKG